MAAEPVREVGLARQSAAAHVRVVAQVVGQVCNQDSALTSVGLAAVQDCNRDHGRTLAGEGEWGLGLQHFRQADLVGLARDRGSDLVRELAQAWLRDQVVVRELGPGDQGSLSNRLDCQGWGATALGHDYRTRVLAGKTVWQIAQHQCKIARRASATA